jgi:hypothetical protein
MMSPTRVSLAAVFVAFVSLPVSAQTLAEASAAAKKIVHEWPASTNLGTPTAIEPTVAPAAADSTTEPATTTKTTGSTEKKTTKESYWRDRLAVANTQLATDRAALGPLDTRYEELRAKYNNMDTVFQQQLVAPEMFRMQTEVKAATERIATDLRAIDDLREEGRKAGALPGWLR